MNEYIKDNLDFFAEHEARLARQLERLPVCAICDEPIQTEKLYLINGKTVCPSCLKWEYEKDVEDYIE